MFTKLLARLGKRFDRNSQKHRTKLKAGDKAPEIFGVLQNGKNFDYSAYKGKKIVLYFYPEDGTAGCTAQACSLRDNYEYMQKQGYSVIGVSMDSVEKHKSFIQRYNLPFPLIADVDRKLIDAYDVWGARTLLGKSFDGIIRTTFVINENGMIDEVITDIDTIDHGKQILATDSH